MLPLETPKRESVMFQCLMCNNQWKGMTMTLTNVQVARLIYLAVH